MNFAQSGFKAFSIATAKLILLPFLYIQIVSNSDQSREVVLMLELVLLSVIYAIWILLLVNVMVSCDEVSLTVATLPFIVTFPFTLILASISELVLPGIFIVNVLLILIVGVLLFVRWVMAIVGE